MHREIIRELQEQKHWQRGEEQESGERRERREKKRGNRIIVFNPLSWEVKNWVEVELSFKRGEILRIGGLRSGDEEIEVEVIKFSRYEDDTLRYAKIGFVATVPPLGYKIYEIMEREPKERKGRRENDERRF